MSDGSNEIRTYTASVSDVAAHFGVHTATVYNWLKSDSPPPHRKIRGQYRFNLEELDVWTAGHPTEGAA